MQLQTFDLIYSRHKIHFKGDGTPKCLFFQSGQRYCRRIDNGKSSSAWKSKELSDESIKTPTTFNNGVSPALNYISAKIQAKFDGSCLKPDKLILSQKIVVNIYYIEYEIYLRPFKQSAAFIFGNSLFGTVEFTKNADFDKYKYSRYGTVFNLHGSFHYLMVLGLFKT